MTPPPKTARRGVAVAVLVVVLAGLNLAVIASVTAGADDGGLAAARVQTLRAFYAAESGARAAVAAYEAGAQPQTGPVALTGGPTFDLVAVPTLPAGSPQPLIVQGRSGDAARRLEINVQ